MGRAGLVCESPVRFHSTQIDEATYDQGRLGAANALINTWTGKLEYPTSRPITAINEGDFDLAPGDGSTSTDPDTDAQTEKDILKLMQQLMTQPKPS